MASRGYYFALQWIADNDEPAEKDLEVIATLVSVALVADMFGKTQEKVAAGVARRRKDVDAGPTQVRR